jgi:hypothetical protein
MADACKANKIYYTLIRACEALSNKPDTGVDLCDEQILNDPFFILHTKIIRVLCEDEEEEEEEKQHTPCSE